MSSRRFVLGVSTIVFAASAAMTIAGTGSMSATGTMDMPGGWAMSMMWMRMPGQSWLGAAAEFVGIWVGMMVTMMLPSLTPTLWRYRESLGVAHGVRLGGLTALVGVGDFAVWTVLGAVVFGVGGLLAAVVMRERALAGAVPIVVGAAMLIAGVVQHTGWKARQLAICRKAADHGLTPRAGVGAAWSHGLCVGLHCVQSCAALTVVGLALGAMDLRVMAAVAAAVSVERFAPNGVRAARAIGIVLVVAGLWAIAQRVTIAQVIELIR